MSAGILYLIATPIGNLADMSQRAITLLSEVDIIAAEDKRHSQHLLNHFGIRGQLQAYHEHNEDKKSAELIDSLKQGSAIALISDAGTPLVSDPGYRLVALAHQHGIQVVPVPGPCAAVAALSAAGLATDRFVFEGFPPAKQGARINYFAELKSETRTLLFYVACHRVAETVDDMKTVFGEERRVTFARELTKNFETIRNMTLADLSAWLKEDKNQHKGEIVIVVAGADKRQNKIADVDAVLEILLEELPVKQAAKIASRLTGINKNELYKSALDLKKD